MKKLLLPLLLSLVFTGSAYAAADVYSCKYKTIELMGNNIKSNILSPEITLIVEKKQITSIYISSYSGKAKQDVFKILKEDKRFGLVALKKPSWNSISTLYFNKRTKRFSMADLILEAVTSYSGNCTFMYTQ